MIKIRRQVHAFPIGSNSELHFPSFVSRGIVVGMPGPPSSAGVLIDQRGLSRSLGGAVRRAQRWTGHASMQRFRSYGVSRLVASGICRQRGKANIEAAHTLAGSQTQRNAGKSLIGECCNGA